MQNIILQLSLTNIIEGTIIGLLVLFIGWLFNYIVKRISQRKLTKAERLKVALEKHRREMRNLGAVALKEVLFSILYIFGTVLGLAAMNFFIIGEFLTFATSETTSAESHNRIFRFLGFMPAILIVGFALLNFGPINHIVTLLNFSDWKENHLIRRIKQIEPTWEDK